MKVIVYTFLFSANNGTTWHTMCEGMTEGYQRKHIVRVQQFAETQSGGAESIYIPEERKVMISTGQCIWVWEGKQINLFENPEVRNENQEQ